MGNPSGRSWVFASVAAAGALLAYDTSAAPLWQIVEVLENPGDEVNFGRTISVDDRSALVNRYLFDIRTGELQRTFDPQSEAPGLIGTSANAVRSGESILSETGDEYVNGAAYLFDNNSGERIATYSNPNPPPGDNAFYDYFAYEVDFFDDQVLIGNPFRLYEEDGSIEGVPGKIYIFDKNSGQIVNTLASPTASYGDYFGDSMSVSGDRVIVGADGDDTAGRQAGAAFVFDGKSGELLQVLQDPEAGDERRFGSRVDAFEDYGLVSAPRDGVYLFDLRTGALVQSYSDPTPDAPGGFGASVGIDGNWVIIGEPTGSPVGFPSAVHIYDTFSGKLLQTLLEPGALGISNFGIELDIFGDRAVVGSTGGPAVVISTVPIIAPVPLLGTLAPIVSAIAVLTGVARRRRREAALV